MQFSQAQLLILRILSAPPSTLNHDTKLILGVLCTEYYFSGFMSSLKDTKISVNGYRVAD